VKFEKKWRSSMKEGRQLGGGRGEASTTERSRKKRKKNTIRVKEEILKRREKLAGTRIVFRDQLGRLWL
jgi:hypothetical protein